MLGHYNKAHIRKNLLEKINNLSKKKPSFIIIACHSASSCILDILIKNNFFINNIPVFEPVLPMCIHIKDKKYKNILVLSTIITQKTQWHYRFLNKNGVQIKYITFPLLAVKIENNSDEITNSINRLKNKKDFLKICDCVVLGCTHYNIIKNLISKELKIKYKYDGVILDSNEILLQYFKKKAL